MGNKLKDEDRRKRINILLSDNERKILKEKMDKYGYKDLSVYVRDASIYESLYVENIEGKLEVCRCVSELSNDLRKYRRELNKMLLKACLTKVEINDLTLQNRILNDSMIELIKTIDKILFISVKEIQRNPDKFIKQEKLF